MTEKYRKRESPSTAERTATASKKDKTGGAPTAAQECHYLSERGWFVLRLSDYQAEYIYFTYERIGPGRGISTPHIAHITTDLKGNLDTLLEEGDSFPASLYHTVRQRALQKESVGYTTPD